MKYVRIGMVDTTSDEACIDCAGKIMTVLCSHLIANVLGSYIEY